MSKELQVFKELHPSTEWEEPKKLRSMTWKEWLDLWKKNDIRETAIMLIRYGFKVAYSSADAFPIEFNERVRFYLKIIQAYHSPPDPNLLFGRPGPNEIIRREAYQEVARVLYKLFCTHAGWPEVAGSETHPWADLFGYLIDFFSENKIDLGDIDDVYEAQYYEKSGLPDNNANYRVKERCEGWIKTFFQLLSRSLLTRDFQKGNSLQLPSGVKQALEEKKDAISKVLVNFRLFDFIRDEGIIEAIPILKEEIYRRLYGRREGTEEDFPGGKAEFMQELENPKSLAFRVALDRGTHEEGREDIDGITCKKRNSISV